MGQRAPALSVEQFDIDPYPAYAHLRRHDPVAWMPWAHSYFVTRWDDVRALAANPDTFSAAVHDSPLTTAIGPNLLHSDGTYHDQLRAPLTDNLRPAAIARRMRGVVESLVEELLDRFESGGEVDLIADFAQPLAIRVLTEVTGLPAVSETTLIRWLEGIAAGASNYERDPAKTALSIAANAEMESMLADSLRVGPRDGSLIAALSATPIDGRPMAFQELAATVKLLIIGGMQEPRDLFGFAADAMLQRADIRDRLLSDPTAFGPLIEESLRWGSPVGTVTRRTTHPVTLSGVDLPEGAVLAGVISSANRDESHWDNPDEFDIDRTDFQHLAFNAGAHACVGASLARMEATHAIRELVTQFPDVELVAGPIVSRGWEFRGPVSIPVRLGRRVGATSANRVRVGATRDLRVTALEEVSSDVLLLSLEPDDGSPLPSAEPGAHIDVTIPGDTAKPERQYSLTGPQLGTEQWQIAVRRQEMGGGGSLWLHREVAAGDSLRVGVPRNHFRLVDAPGYIFIAGGIGITPILPMLDRARRSGRPWRLHYIGRSLDSMPFRDLVRGAETILWDTNRTGRPELDTLVEGMPPESAVYCCGPESLLDAIEARSVSGSGPWSNLKLHVERFAPRLRASAGSANDTAFDVDLQRSGRTVHVARDCSLLDALQASDILVPSTCREGTCGSCETAVLAGEIDHRDSVLDPDERARNDAMMVCVSRARSPRLVLDL